MYDLSRPLPVVRCCLVFIVQYGVYSISLFMLLHLARLFNDPVGYVYYIYGVMSKEDPRMRLGRNLQSCEDTL